MRRPLPESDTAVLLMGYGSPDRPSDLPEYLTDVLGGRPPNESMLEDYRRRYNAIEGSPQRRILESLRAKLEHRVKADQPGARVYLGMKHFRPHLSEVIPSAAHDGFRRLVAVPLSPYPSPWIMQPYERGIADGRARADRHIVIELRAGWHRNRHLIEYWANATSRTLRSLGASPAVTLLSAHSLPERRKLEGDTYPDLLFDTATRISRTARLSRWDFTYQSAGNTTEPWLGPDITEKIVEWQRKGFTQQVVAAFGFLFDHLEVLYDLDIVVRAFAEKNGVNFHRVPMPNDDNRIVEALHEVAFAPGLGV